jgi:hypothetical protein
MNSLTRLLIGAALVFALVIALRDQARRHPERLPWTAVTLQQPIGPFTAVKLAALADDTPQCLALLDFAAVGYVPAKPATMDICTNAGAIDLTTGATWAPKPPGVTCPVAAALHLWQERIVAPAAQKHFGQKVVSLDHLGSFNCRRIADSPNWSQHATANAIDIAGFTLADGTSIRVREDWNGAPAKAAFLRQVRDGACRVFTTTLSPDYNEAHADHFHLDQAARMRSVCN